MFIHTCQPTFFLLDIPGGFCCSLFLFMLWHSKFGRMHFRQHGAKRFALQRSAEAEVWRFPAAVTCHLSPSIWAQAVFHKVTVQGHAISLNVVLADNQIDYKHLLHQVRLPRYRMAGTFRLCGRARDFRIIHFGIQNIVKYWTINWHFLLYGWLAHVLIIWDTHTQTVHTYIIRNTCLYNLPCLTIYKDGWCLGRCFRRPRPLYIHTMHTCCCSRHSRTLNFQKHAISYNIVDVIPGYFFVCASVASVLLSAIGSIHW